MSYQTIKYFLVRIGISIFLMGFFGFIILYFFHEVASFEGRFDDNALHLLLLVFFLIFGFFIYGFFGKKRFEKALKTLRDIESNEVGADVITEFESLISFTYSSFFLPSMGRNLRSDVIKEYADFLHSKGKDDHKALKIYLKAYLQDPKNSRFRLPILAALKRQNQLPTEEIDLLLLMFKTGKVEDKKIASHLADIFIKKNRFNQKTEPVFLRVIESGLENSSEVCRFLLPRLLKKNRIDEYALKFFIKSLPYAGSSKEHIKLVLGKSYCEGHWESVDPDLHAQCGLVFEGLPIEKKEELKKQVLDNKVGEKWKRVKLFGDEDLKTLRLLQFKFGVIRPGWDQIKEVILFLILFLKKGTKKTLLFGIDLLFKYGRLGLRAKIFSLFVLVLGGVIFFQIKKNTNVIIIENSPKNFVGPSKENKTINQIEYTLQIAATTRKQEANKMIARLKKKGIEGLYIVQTFKLGGGNWYKIRVGSFFNQKHAKGFGSKLVNKKLIQNYFIVANKK